MYSTLSYVSARYSKPLGGGGGFILPQKSNTKKAFLTFCMWDVFRSNFLQFQFLVQGLVDGRRGGAPFCKTFLLSLKPVPTFPEQRGGKGEIELTAILMSQRSEGTQQKITFFNPRHIFVPKSTKRTFEKGGKKNNWITFYGKKEIFFWGNPLACVGGCSIWPAISRNWARLFLSLLLRQKKKK